MWVEKFLSEHGTRTSDKAPYGTYLITNGEDDLVLSTR